jgi:hypothetical protein
MLERFTITIATTTVLAVLGKVALLYRDALQSGRDWFQGPVEQSLLAQLMLSLYLIFFRGKMMHDDATFCADLVKPEIFKRTGVWSLLIKFGFFLGYLSWLFWAPAIYFLDNPTRLSGFLITAIALSTIWLVIDVLTRRNLEWRRAFWIIPNILYIGFLVLYVNPHWASISAAGLLMILTIEWLISDPFYGHISTT